MSASYTETARLMRSELDAAELCALLADSPPGNADQESNAPKKQPVTAEVVRGVLAELGITVRYNVLLGYVAITGLPDRYSRENAANTLPVYLLDYMKMTGLKCARATLDDYLALIADENRFNPVFDYLTGVQWDGVDRLGDIYDILGIFPLSDSATYIRKWFVQCVALALNDEARPVGADGVLVLQGPQGCGKTRFFAVLAPYPEWFVEGATIDVDNKDSIIRATSAWIVELGELDSTLKREQSALKAHLTSSCDLYRPPYARVQVRKPRRASYCGTVNTDAFLVDDTGSRRYWTVPVSRIDLEKLNSLTPEWKQQFWTQIYALYRENPNGFRLTPDERARLTRNNQRFDKPLPYETEVRDMLDFGLPEHEWRFFKSTAIKDRIGYGATAEQVGRVLKKLAKEDERIKVKHPKGVWYYLLPVPPIHKWASS